MLGTFVRCFIFGKYTYREKKTFCWFFIYLHNLFTQFIVFFSFDINVKQRRKSVKNILQTVAIIILYFSFLSASLSGEICYATCIWNYKKTKWLLIEFKKKTVFWVLRYNFLMTFYLFLSTGEYGVQSPEGYLSSCRFSVCSLPSWQSWSQQSA